MKARIVKNWKSSLLGIVLLIAALVAVFLNKATWEQFATFVPFCLGLVYVKDTIFKIGGGGTTLTIVVVALFCLLGQGCVSYERCVKKYGVVRHDSLIITKEIPIIIKVPIPSDSMQTSINIDSIQFLIEGQVYQKFDSTSKIQIWYWKDKFNKLQIKALQPPDTVIIYKTIEVKVPCPPIIELKEHLTWYQSLFLWYKNFSAVAFFIGLLIILFKRPWTKKQ